MLNEYIEEYGIRVLPQKSEEADSAIYIMPDGRFLSGISKDAVESGYNQRDIDHRSISYYMDTNPYVSDNFWKDMFKKTGFVMVVPETRKYIIVEVPTIEQKKSCAWLDKLGFEKSEW